MTSAADDTHSPPADVQQSSTSIRDKNNSQKEESVDQPSSKNAQEDPVQHSVTVPEIDILGLVNSGGNPVKYGVTDAPAGARSRSDEEMQISRETNQNEDHGRDFPPLLTTFNITGKPKFDFVKVRETGRLQVFMVPNKQRPMLVRSPLRDGRLKMWIVDGKELDEEEVLPLFGCEDDRQID